MARIGFAAWKGGAVFVDPTEVVAVSAGKVGTTRIECRDGTLYLVRESVEQVVASLQAGPALPEDGAGRGGRRSGTGRRPSCS